jgi:hypothetical protein
MTWLRPNERYRIKRKNSRWSRYIAEREAVARSNRSAGREAEGDQAEGLRTTSGAR